MSGWLPVSVRSRIRSAFASAFENVVSSTRACGYRRAATAGLAQDHFFRRGASAYPGGSVVVNPLHAVAEPGQQIFRSVEQSKKIAPRLLPE
jgi:hypothetical protein